MFAESSIVKGCVPHIAQNIGIDARAEEHRHGSVVTAKRRDVEQAVASCLSVSYRINGREGIIPFIINEVALAIPQGRYLI